MTLRRYAAAGSEAEFQPGSRGRVLRNFLGITKVREMEEAETQALIAAQRAARTLDGSNHRFTADIRRLHRMWLGSIYPWAGNYRTVNIGKGGLQFAHAPLVPRLMAIWKGRATPTYARLEVLPTCRLRGHWRRSMRS